MKIPHRKGLPALNLLLKVLDEKFPDCIINSSDSYKYTGNICWQREYMNNDMLIFKDYLVSLGIKVTEYSPYKSMSGRVGFIKIERIEK